MRFIDEHKARAEGGLRWGVEPICTVLSEHGCPIAPSTYYDASGRLPSARSVRDEQLKAAITAVHAGNYGVYGARTTWLPPPPLSTAAPARRSPGRPRPRRSTSSCTPANKAVLRRPLEPKQYTSIAFTERLAAAGAQPSVGSVGDAYDNALAESVIGLYKTELIKPRGPWRTAEQVEIATLHYVDWFNRQRLFEACGDIPPAELETAYYRHNSDLAEVG